MFERSWIDLEEQVALSHRLILQHMHPHHLAFDSRCYLNDVRLHVPVRGERRVAVCEDIVRDQDGDNEEDPQYQRSCRQQDPAHSREQPLYCVPASAQTGPEGLQDLHKLIRRGSKLITALLAFHGRPRLLRWRRGLRESLGQRLRSGSYLRHTVLL